MRNKTLLFAVIALATPTAWAGAPAAPEAGALLNAPSYVTEGHYKASTLGTLSQPQPTLPSTGPVYGIKGPWPLYTAKLHPGKGEAAVQGNCSICHAVTYITMQPPLPAPVWKAEVDKMMNVMGAKQYIDPATAAEIVTYLQTYYVPGKRTE